MRGGLEVEPLDRAQLAVGVAEAADRDGPPRSAGRRCGSAAKSLASAGHLGILAHSALLTKKVRKVDNHPARSTHMDPAIIVFGFGIGVLVGMTGMGGGSLMTPLLILIFGIQPTTAIGTDIFYSAVTKTVGGWRHLRMKTVNMELVKWLAFGSVPAAVPASRSSRCCRATIGEDRLDSLVYAVLGGTLLMVGIITLARALILRNLVDERDRFEVERRHKVAAVVIGATTGFVIGITSAGSGTVIAILLIAVYRLTPKKVVGTDVFHAAILLWAAGIAHWVGGNVDFVLAGNILLGSIPGVVIGAALSDRAPAGLHPHRPRRRPGRLRDRHDPEGRPERLADRRRGRRHRARRSSSPLPRWLHTPPRSGKRQASRSTAPRSWRRTRSAD